MVKLLLILPLFSFGQTRYELACQIIKKHEGFSLVAYKDGSRYSIGYGTKSFPGEKITRKEAQLRFRDHMEKVAKIVQPLKIKDDVLYACMCDLAYNVGSIPENIKKNIGNKYKVARLLPGTVKSRKFKKGLLKRRLYCKDLLLKP